MDKKTKVALIAAGILAVVLIAVAIVAGSDRSVQIVVVPEDATITIDGQPAKAGKQTLKPGTHTIKGTRQYFTDYETTVNTKDVTNGQKIYLVLGSNTDQAKQWLYDNKGDPQLRQEAGDAIASQVNNQLQNDYPFLQKLPYESTDFKIDYTLSEDRKTLSFQITLLPYYLQSNPGYKQQLHDFKAEALKWMSDNGIDTGKYSITYDPAEAKDL